MGINNWKAEISLLDEFFGREPKYPLSTQIAHQNFEFNRQNEILNNLSVSQQNEIRETTSLVCGSIKDGFNELYNVNSNGFNKIISTIENSVEDINENLWEVNRNLEEINSTLHWGFSSLIEQLTINNNRLNQIIELLNIPDTQKQRKYHIEQGFEFMKKGNYDSIFYKKAKENFEKVIEIEDSDYLSLQQLGIIHLYCDSFLDLELSKKYFEQSIIYSKSDINFKKNIQNPSSFQFTYNPAKLTATSYMHLSRLFFIKEEINNAIRAAEKGLEIYEMLPIFFDLCKYYAAIEDKENAINYLDIAISKDRFITVKIINEKNLITKDYITLYLNKIAKDVINKVNEDLKKLKLISHKNSIYFDKIIKIESLISKNNYLDALKSLELIGYDLKN